MAVGNKHLAYKDALNAIELTSPGSKHDFYFGFLARAAEQFAEGTAASAGDLTVCRDCGAPTTNEVCAFCSLVARARAQQPVPVPLTRRGA